MTDQHPTRVTLLQKLQTTQDDHSWNDFVKYYEGYIYVVIRNLGVSVELLPAKSALKSSA